MQRDATARAEASTIPIGFDEASAAGDGVALSRARVSVSRTPHYTSMTGDSP
jgi:hypothetical protein